MRAPPDVCDMEHVGLQYLQKARDVLVKWKMTGTSDLTRETFTACMQSIDAVYDLAIHLQQMHEFSCVLTRKFLSEPIEGRIGWYREVHGVNFYILIRQVLQPDEKIRCLSLLQEQALVSASNLMALDSLPP